MGKMAGKCFSVPEEIGKKDIKIKVNYLFYDFQIFDINIKKIREIIKRELRKSFF